MGGLVGLGFNLFFGAIGLGAIVVIVVLILGGVVSLSNPITKPASQNDSKTQLLREIKKEEEEIERISKEGSSNPAPLLVGLLMGGLFLIFLLSPSSKSFTYILSVGVPCSLILWFAIGPSTPKQRGAKLNKHKKRLQELKNKSKEIK